MHFDSPPALEKETEVKIQNHVDFMKGMRPIEFNTFVNIQLSKPDVLRALDNFLADLRVIFTDEYDEMDDIPTAVFKLLKIDTNRDLFIRCISEHIIKTDVATTAGGASNSAGTAKSL